MVNPMKKVKPTRILMSLVLGLGLASTTFQLGQWQTSRAQEKLAILAKQEVALSQAPLTPQVANIPVDDVAFRRIKILGQFVPNAVVYIDNRQFAGKPAVQVIQAFKPEGKNFVIPIDLGYLPRDPRDPRRAPDLPRPDVITQQMQLEATLLPHFARSAELRGMTIETGNDILQEESNGMSVWSNFDNQAFAKKIGMTVSSYVATVQPIYLSDDKEATQLPSKVNGFYINGVKLPEQVAKHRGYAFQWFAMTAALVLLTGFLVFREYKDSTASTEI